MKLHFMVPLAVILCVITEHRASLSDVVLVVLVSLSDIASCVAGCAASIYLRSDVSVTPHFVEQRFQTLVPWHMSAASGCRK